VSIVNVGDVGLYHYARILQRRDGVPLPVPVACITDRDVVPVEATYVPHPKKKGKKRFFDDYTPVELAGLVDAKVNRASGGSTVVCVSDHWTLEYDLALAGCARLMHDAIGLAVRAKKDGGFLLAGKLDEATKSVAADWVALEAEGLSPCARAARIYEPLYRKRASKAVAAQYAAALLESGAYGNGQPLFDTLPPYLQTALTHLTGGPGTLSS
jgi:putative ATP-dependent endonuclease of OLD family